MATIKICTSIEQSRKLAKILPPDSADMYWWQAEGKEYVYVGKCSDNNSIPAWSLAALLSVLPSFMLETPLPDTSDDRHYRLHCRLRHSEWHNNPVDACYEMILKLKEQGLL